jgi:hypothetical protein
MKNTSKKVKFEAAKVASTFVDVTSTTSQTELRYFSILPKNFPKEKKC